MDRPAAQSRKSLDERNRGLVPARMKGADIEFLCRPVLEYVRHHGILRVWHVSEKAFFPWGLIGHDARHGIAG